MTCPRCGFSCEEDAKFCLSCGTKFQTETASPFDTISLSPATAPTAEKAPTEMDVAASSAAEPSTDHVPPPPFHGQPPAVSSTPSPHGHQPPPPPFFGFPPMPVGEEPVSVWKWLGLMLLESFVGIAHLVLMFVFSFSGTTDKNLKNYSRAKLIMAALKLILSIVMVVVAFNAIMEFIEMVIYYSYTYPM